MKHDLPFPVNNNNMITTHHGTMASSSSTTTTTSSTRTATTALAIAEYLEDPSKNRSGDTVKETEQPVHPPNHHHRGRPGYLVHVVVVDNSDTVATETTAVNKKQSNSSRSSTPFSHNQNPPGPLTTTTQSSHQHTIEIVAVPQQRHNHHQSTSTTYTATNVFSLFASFFLFLHTVAKDLFLPVGYPGTVRSGYLSYQVYDSLQGLCSYLRGVLCHAALLQAAGVGDATATAWAAAVTWAWRDGLALTGGLLYSYHIAHLLDAHVKEFRLFADVINDVGFLLDMLAPHFGKAYFLHVSSVAALCRTLCGISAGATKGSITLHFALDGNMADLNAKEATQETMVSLMGMILGIYAAQMLQSLGKDDDTTIHSNTTNTSRFSQQAIANWSLFIVLTAVHLWANYQGVSLLRLRTLNRSRTDLLLQSLFRASTATPSAMTSTATQIASTTTTLAASAAPTPVSPMLDPQFLFNNNTLPTPDQVFESLTLNVWRKFFAKDRFHLGVPLTTILTMSNTNRLYFPPLLLEDNKDAIAKSDADHASSSSKIAPSNYIVTVGGIHRNEAFVCLGVGATQHDQFQAYVHASLLLYQLDEVAPQSSTNGQPNETTRKTTVWSQLSSTQLEAIFHQVQETITDAWFGNGGSLVTALRQKGWDVDGRFYLEYSNKRSCWRGATKDDASLLLSSNDSDTKQQVDNSKKIQ